MTCPHFPNAPEPRVLRTDGDPRKCTRRLLTIHAHPDDETTKGGGSVARYAAAGVGTVLVCCTGGEAGSVLNPALDQPEVKARLPEVRRQELSRGDDASRLSAGLDARLPGLEYASER